MRVERVVIKDTITPALSKYIAQMNTAGRTRIMAAAGKGLEKHLRQHFLQKNAKPNKRGWPKRNFWSKVRQATTLTSYNDRFATVTVASRPFLAHLHGARIVPKRAKALSIPLTARAYKTGSASLFKQKLVMIKPKGRDPLLVQFKGKKRKGKPRDFTPHYVLKKKSHVPKDPTALPSRASTRTAVNRIVEFQLRRVKRESGI